MTGDGCTSIYSSTVLLVRDTKRCDAHQWSCLGNYPMCRYGYTSNFIFLKTQRTCCAACLCPYSGVFFPVHFESTKQGCVQMRKHLVSVTASVVLFWAGIPCVAKALEFWNTWTWHLSLEISQNSLVSRYEEEGWKHDFWRSSPKTNAKLKATAFSGCVSVKKKHAAGLTGGGMVDGWRWKESRQREK